MSRSVDAIESPDTSGDRLVSRFPSTGAAEIRLGTQLFVRESQAAVLFRDGRALDTFGPGRHTLSNVNVPLLARWLQPSRAAERPFRCELFFVNLRSFAEQPWATTEPIVFRDEELSVVRLRASGSCGFRVTNPQVFVKTLAGTVGPVRTDTVSDFFRGLIVTHLADFLRAHVRTLFDLAACFPELSAGVRANLVADFENYGVRVGDFRIQSITPPDHVQEMIDKRCGIPTTGNGGPGRPSPTERMRDLKALLEEGLISQDEFQAKRREILAAL